MKTIQLISSGIIFITFLFSSCNSGGVSEQFTKEINEFETAWINTETSFFGIIDSVKATNDSWTLANNEMKVPDTLKENIDESNTKKLDSLKSICGNQNASCASLLKSLEDYKASWIKESKAFSEWKDRVLKGEIDIATAKKDLIIFKSKLNDAAQKSSQGYDKLSDLKVACSGNCNQYNQLLTSLAAVEEDPKNKNK